MRQGGKRGIVAGVMSAVVAAGFSGILGGCGTPESRPVMYGTDGTGTGSGTGGKGGGGR